MFTVTPGSHDLLLRTPGTRPSDMEFLSDSDLSRVSLPSRNTALTFDSTGVVISDLHIFATRSSPAGPLHRLYRDLSKCNYCVLNGDIFDFGWSKLSSIEQSIHAAERYLTSLCKKYPKCRFIFVVGNHD